MKKVNDEVFAGYIPVVHDGYIRAIDRHPAAIIGVLNNEVLADFDYIRKDIRALQPELVEQLLTGMGRTVIMLGKTALKEVLTSSSVIMPNDDISREIARQNPKSDITFEQIFLRWDRDNSKEAEGIVPDRVVDWNSDDPIISTLRSEEALSTNWWRHVGAVVIDKDRNIRLASHNSPIPTEYTSIFEGDPRITANRGEAIDRSIDKHAEWGVIAEAAKRGISLEGMSICVSMFPCPICAKLIALSGIKNCYYVEGYAVLDGQRILKEYGIEIVKIDTPIAPEDPRSLKPYPTKS